MEAQGYLHPEYAATLAEFGRPRVLSRCGGSLLQRRIGDTGSSDAMGPYPLFCCLDWSRLGEDLRRLEGELVSVTLVTDPLGDYTESQLADAFPDLARAYKEGFVVDLTRTAESFVSEAHRRNARKALRRVEVHAAAEPSSLAETWCRLYESLRRRHDIRGIAALSPGALARQLRLSGTVALYAAVDGDIVGMTVWYVHGDVGYYHLGAFSESGYRLRAGFAIFSRALEHFAAAGIRWLSLGGAAGAGKVEADDGLARFKRGWSTGSRTMYLCGRILDRETYRQLTRGASGTKSYFPAYRAGEFR